jgi:D-3-phosphoglycerate dehydrogenase
MSRPHILVSEHLGERALALLSEAAEVEAYDLLPEDEFRRRLPEADAVIIRSAHSLRTEHLELARRLKVAARAGAGVDNIDIEAATQRGILVINTPGANAVAAAEHTFGLLLAVMRRIVDADRHVREGQWDRQQFFGWELRGRRLGIIGIGRVGSQVAKRARGFDMDVYAYDPYVAPDIIRERGAKPVERLEDLLAVADVLTLHTPKTGPRLGRAELERLPRGAVVVNAARGGLVDEDALAALLETGHIRAAALDVFSQEPPRLDHPLFRLPRVVVTCHLGGSTVEAQWAIGERVAKAVLAALEGQVPEGAVNLPATSEGDQVDALVEMGRILGRLLAFSGAKGQTLKVEPIGKAAGLTELVSRAVLWGFLQAVGEESVNLVSAIPQARHRGIVAVAQQPVNGGEHREREPGIRAWFDDDVQGAVEVTRREEIRLRRFWGARFDMGLSPYMLVTRHNDRPGIVGAIGRILGDAAINIATLELGRHAPGGEAVMLLGLDNPVPDHVVRAIQALDAMRVVHSLNVGGEPAGVF